MITEDFVSLEIARLLKEKGFDENCAALYHLRTGEIIQQGVGYVFNNSQWENFVSAPTLQMAAKWLREVHKLFIFISTWLMHENSVQYYFEIREIKTDDFETLYDYTSKEVNSFEKVADAAIKYSLESLI